MSGVIAAALLLGAVAVVLGPRRGARRRLRGRRRARVGFDPSRVRAITARLLTGPVWRAVCAAAGLAAVPGLLLGGPAGGVIAAVYTGLGVAEWIRRAGRRRAAAARAAALDGLGAVAADLRAGLPAAALPAAPGPDGTGRIHRLAGAVGRLAEQTGAPAAELLERIEADARSADRATAAAAAQAAGAQATALLLAVLPLGGIALGYAIGAEPLRVLLRTPLGAGCALTAVLLQAVGLRWSQRLVDGPR